METNRDLCNTGGFNFKATIQMKAIGQYFPVELFITLHMVVPTFECVDDILKCDHSNKSY